MRLWGTILWVALVMLPVVVGPVFANTNAKFTIDRDGVASIEGGRVAIPIRAQQITDLRAGEVVLEYDGEIRSVEFIPSTYLYDPVWIEPKVDRQNRTILIAVCASNGIVTRDASGSLGTVVVEGNVNVEMLRVVSAKLLAEDNKLRTLVDAAAARSLHTDEAPREDEPRILRTELFQSFPNPANPTTNISFALKDEGHVSLRIYNVRGQLVRTLVDGPLKSNRYSFAWDALDRNGNTVASGIYFYRLSASGYVEQKKLVILK